eukprot:GFUD01044498.1.p1 GENE.GFUD01044498.1~~GFUD01044498.1.p1  ORF type:complete len:337 (-),score=54.72 GFUD01044498.1:334-1344(-)
MNVKAQLAILTVLIGCCCNVIFLELMIKQDPGCGNLITFSQFIVIAIEGLVFTTRFLTVKPKVPFSSWIILVVMFFLVSVSNNYALNFNIPMPLHMIFRAGSLMANMLMGIALLGKRYSITKYLSVLMITLGITICTLMSAKSSPKADSSKTDSENATQAEEDKFWLIIGISLLTFALFMSARMGIYQEVIYGKFGKHPKEALFYTHALPLPGFLLLAPDIIYHWHLLMASAPINLPVLNFSIPSMLLYLIGNVLTQYICISSVFILTTECASLTVTLVVTLRKFLSLLFSILYFNNPFTAYHWLGTGLVFGGTLLFSDIPGLIRASKEKKEKKLT